LDVLSSFGVETLLRKLTPNRRSRAARPRYLKKLLFRPGGFNGRPIDSALVGSFELELQAAPTEGLELGFNLAYLDFQITEFDPTVIGITVDNKQVRSPEWSGSAYLKYRWALQNNAEVYVRGDWAYADDSFSDMVNTPSIIRKAHSTFNMRINYLMPDNGR
jgi:hypothetical protein